MEEEYESEVHVYIIGGISYEKHTPVFSENGESKYTVPEFVEMLNMDELNKLIDGMRESTGREVTVHFVDPKLKIRYYYTPEGRAYFNHLHDIRTSDEYKNVIFHDCQWYEMRDDFKVDKQNDYYILTVDNEYENLYDFLNFLEMKVYDCVYLKYGITSMLDVFDARCPYNIFGVPDDYETSIGEPPLEDPDAINWIIENGVATVKAFINAGFLEKERYIQAAVPCWTLNVESHFTKGIILEYELFPPRKVVFNEKLCVGKTIQEKFTESADYRYTITDCICRVLCQIGIRYGKLKEVKRPHKVNFDLLL